MAENPSDPSRQTDGDSAMEKKAEEADTRGLDGLSSAELLATRQGFWGDGFTEVILCRIPDGAKSIVDIGCGLAAAAHALLPRLPAVNYIGVDADELRLRNARELLAGKPYEARVELRIGQAEKLPFGDAEASFAMCCMTLQHLLDPATAVRQISRILDSNGRVVVAEPDNLSNLFYFDANLEEVNSAFRGLFLRLRRERFPRDCAIGPNVAKLFEREKFSIAEFFPYMVGKAKRQTARQSFDRARQIVKIVSHNLPPENLEVRACNIALDRAESSIGSETFGYYCQLVPLFICVADKINR